MSHRQSYKIQIQRRFHLKKNEKLYSKQVITRKLIVNKTLRMQLVINTKILSIYDEVNVSVTDSNTGRIIFITKLRTEINARNPWLLVFQKHLPTHPLSKNRNIHTHKFIISTVFHVVLKSLLSLWQERTLIVFENITEEKKCI